MQDLEFEIRITNLVKEYLLRVVANRATWSERPDEIRCARVFEVFCGQYRASVIVSQFALLGSKKLLQDSVYCHKKKILEELASKFELEIAGPLATLLNKFSELDDRLKEYQDAQL